MIPKSLIVFFRQRQNYLSYSYAFFLVFITPLSIPAAWWTWHQGLVTGAHVGYAILMYSLSALGITLGYHRLTTHRSYQAKPWLKRAILICGSFAMQGGPAAWASLHIQHHRYADKPGDPHSPKEGFWHSHCGWIFHDYKPNYRRFGKWLLEDKDVKHVSKYYLLYSNLSLIVPALLGGWVGFIWAGVLRLFLACHVTWSVNSICHRFGKRDHTKTQDTSTNNPIVALLSFGEGWHNNHHRYMQMPFFGHRWYQIDLGKWLLVLFAQLGWVWDLKIPKELRTDPEPTSS